MGALPSSSFAARAAQPCEVFTAAASLRYPFMRRCECFFALDLALKKRVLIVPQNYGCSCTFLTQESGILAQLRWRVDGVAAAGSSRRRFRDFRGGPWARQIVSESSN